MLSSLHVENIAVIRCADMDVSDGFTAVTGETGAGKSVMIDSIGLLLGAKADKDMIRKGADHALVSGLFSNLSSDITEKLHDIGVYLDEDGSILVQRTVGIDGRSQIKINGRTVNLSVLRAVTEGLVNIHGQNDTRALMDPSSHLSLLDLFAGNASLLEKYKTLYAVYEEKKRDLQSLREKTAERERLAEMLQYQIRDIDSASLHAGEEEELVDKKVKLKSSERIVKNTTFAYRALKGSEKGSVSFLLDKTATALAQLSDVIPACAEYSERLRDMQYQVTDIAEEAYAITEELESNGKEDINDIEDRLDKISKLKRKYGLTVADILAFRDKAAAEYDTLINSDDKMVQLANEKAAAYREALSVAKLLHTAREQAAKRLETQVKETLSFLDMPKVVFFASMKETYKEGTLILLPDGTDQVEFFISANSGADPQPMSKIASGGELARIMLALKCSLADKQSVPTLIFDEIDAGVSGKTARKIGLKMKDLASSVQVLCVTHSAQIASLGDTHILIKKQEKNGQTETSLTVLDEEGRIGELSRILGGLNITAAQREAAMDMLKEKET